MHHPTSAEAPLGDHCVCHYPDDTTHTWLIDDEERLQGEQGDAAFSYDDETADLYNTTTTDGASGGKETADDAIDIPPHYTAQGDAIQALYCACFVVNETPGGDLVSPSSIKEGPADPLFAGAVVLNHTSGDYDYIHLQDEFRGLTKASVVLAPPQRPQQPAQADEVTILSDALLTPHTDETTTHVGNGGVLGNALDTQAGLGRYGGAAVMVCMLALLPVLAALRLVRKTRDTPDWWVRRWLLESRYH
ncbi:hypothetical protein PG996_012247 [Apiospora saccharicola]|uniref:Uncharacterized protein n=1 Tax=Apiospora saccharicola TaxID=335842 RepID=A0ABR1U209_9PEZI